MNIFARKSYLSTHIKLLAVSEEGEELGDNFAIAAIDSEDVYHIGFLLEIHSNDGVTIDVVASGGIDYAFKIRDNPGLKKLRQLIQ